MNNTRAFRTAQHKASTQGEHARYVLEALKQPPRSWLRSRQLGDFTLIQSHRGPDRSFFESMPSRPVRSAALRSPHPLWLQQPAVSAVPRIEVCIPIGGIALAGAAQGP